MLVCLTNRSVAVEYKEVGLTPDVCRRSKVQSIIEDDGGDDDGCGGKGMSNYLLCLKVNVTCVTFKYL